MGILTVRCSCWKQDGDGHGDAVEDLVVVYFTLGDNVRDVAAAHHFHGMRADEFLDAVGAFSSHDDQGTLLGFSLLSYGFVVIPDGDVVGDGDAGRGFDGAEVVELGLCSGKAGFFFYGVEHVDVSATVIGHKTYCVV